MGQANKQMNTNTKHDRTQPKQQQIPTRPFNKLQIAETHRNQQHTKQHLEQKEIETCHMITVITTQKHTKRDIKKLKKKTKQMTKETNPKTKQKTKQQKLTKKLYYITTTTPPQKKKKGPEPRTKARPPPPYGPWRLPGARRSGAFEASGFTEKTIKQWNPKKRRTKKINKSLLDIVSLFFYCSKVFLGAYGCLMFFWFCFLES